MKGKPLDAKLALSKDESGKRLTDIKIEIHQDESESGKNDSPDDEPDSQVDYLLRGDAMSFAFTYSPDSSRQEGNEHHGAIGIDLYWSYFNEFWIHEIQ